MKSNSYTICYLDDEEDHLGIGVNSQDEGNFKNIFELNGHNYFPFLDSVDDSTNLEFFKYLNENCAQIDMIFLDHKLKGNKAGWDVAEAIRNNRLFDNIPIVILSSAVDIESLRKYAFEFGVDEFVDKSEIGLKNCNEKLASLFNRDRIKERTLRKNPDYSKLKAVESLNTIEKQNFIDKDDYDKELTSTRSKYPLVKRRLKLMNDYVEVGCDSLFYDIRKFDHIITKEIDIELIKNYSELVNKPKKTYEENIKESKHYAKIFKDFSTNIRTCQSYFLFKNERNEYTKTSLMVFRELVKYGIEYQSLIEWFKSKFLLRDGSTYILNRNVKEDIFVKEVLFELALNNQI